MSKYTISNLSFEEAFDALQAILKQMEEENLPLETSLTLFEKGQNLINHCTEILASAELKLQTLTIEK